MNSKATPWITVALLALLVGLWLVRRTSTPTLPISPDRAESVPDELISQIIAGDRINADNLAPWFESGGKTVYRHRVPGVYALALWKALREKVDQTGYWPVLIGDADSVDMLDETRGFDDATPEQILAAADALDLAAHRLKRQAQYGENPQNIHGHWPVLAADKPCFLVDTDILTGHIRKDVELALVPTPRCWEVLAILRYGNWNDCPEPAVHVATLRDWNVRFGAELVTLTGDTVEMHVARPPQSREAALQLAMEQYLYCGDIVWQGVGTIESLAAGLKDSPIWFFWWD